MTLYDFLFGCTHKHLSFPQSQRKQGKPGNYVVCLDCGKEFGYDWGEMKVVKPSRKRQPEQAIKDFTNREELI